MIPRHRKLLECAFAGTVLDGQHQGLRACERPLRRPEAREDQELYPFVLGFRGGKELIEFGPIGMALDRLEVAPADLESDATDEGIVERFKIQARLERLVLDHDDETVGGRGVGQRRAGCSCC